MCKYWFVRRVQLFIPANRKSNGQSSLVLLPFLNLTMQTLFEGQVQKGQVSGNPNIFYVSVFYDFHCFKQTSMQVKIAIPSFPIHNTLQIHQIKFLVSICDETNFEFSFRMFHYLGFSGQSLKEESSEALDLDLSFDTEFA